MHSINWAPQFIEDRESFQGGKVTKGGGMERVRPETRI